MPSTRNQETPLAYANNNVARRSGFIGVALIGLQDYPCVQKNCKDDFALIGVVHTLFASSTSKQV